MACSGSARIVLISFLSTGIVVFVWVQCLERISMLDLPYLYQSAGLAVLVFPICLLCSKHFIFLNTCILLSEYVGELGYCRIFFNLDSAYMLNTSGFCLHSRASFFFTKSLSFFYPVFPFHLVSSFCILLIVS